MLRERLLQRRSKEHGFTLVELLVVILIIGVLAAIAIPVFMNQRQKAWDASAELDANQAAKAIATVGNDYPAVPPQAVAIEGFSPGDWMDLEVAVVRPSIGMSVGGSTKTYENAIQLSPATRGSVGGTLESYTVCLYNPNGLRFESPETAMVWDSATNDGEGGGTFRDARSDDECVEVARRHEDSSDNPVPPGTPGDGDNEGEDEGEPGEPGEGVDLGITATIGDPQAYHIIGDHNTGIQFLVTLEADDPQLLDGLDVLTLSIGGRETQFNTYGNSYAYAVSPPGYATPGGVAEVKLGDYVLGSRDFSEYEFIGHATLDPSDLAMTRADLARITSWVEDVAPTNANTVSVSQHYQGQDFGWMKQASTNPGGSVSDLDLNSLNFGNDGYNIKAEFDVRSNTVVMEYMRPIGQEAHSIIVAHRAVLNINGEGSGNVAEQHPMVPGQPMGFEAGADAQCAAHEDAFIAFQRAVYAHEPNLWGASYYPGGGAEIGLDTDEGWVDMSLPYDGFASDVIYATVSHTDGYFTGSVELSDNTVCGTIYP